MMKVSPYLNFDGHTAEAMRFYASVFGVEATVMRYADVPGTPAEHGDRTLHAHIEIEDSSIMASDTMPGSQPVFGSNISLTVNLSSHAEQDRIFGALADGGTIMQPLEDAFFGRWGQCKDRYGVQWMIVVAPGDLA